LKTYHVLHSSSEICETWGWINTERKAQPIGMNNAWIAATALTYDIQLITNNARDFTGIKGLQILTAS
jgi:tRNA(fMet)-specific endonuclease VapC